MRIAIIGGGVVGLACGIRLTGAGHAVELIERSSTPDAASWGNAGHIATEQVAPLASPATLRSVAGRLYSRGGALALPPGAIRTWLPFALEMALASTPRRFASGKQALAALLADTLPAWERLGTAIGARDLIREDGHYVAWETPARAAAGLSAWRGAETGTASVSEASPAEIARIERLTSHPISGAARFSGTGQIADLGHLAAAMQHGFIAAGGRIIQRDAEIVRDGDRAIVPGVEADLVLVTAGVRSGALMRPFGHRVPIIAERGYHIRGSAEHWPEDMPPIVFEDRSMIVTRYRDTVQAASFVELGTPDAPPDPRKWARLERHVHELGLPIGRPFTCWMGSRPTLPDYLPAIGRSRRASNLLYAFGHQHLGLTLAPITGGIVVDLVAGRQTAIDISRFDLERFGGTGGKK